MEDFNTHSEEGFESVNHDFTFPPKIDILPVEPEPIHVDEGVTIEPFFRVWRDVLREAGVWTDAELLALDDDKIVNLLNRLVDKREFIIRLSQLRQGK